MRKRLIYKSLIGFLFFTTAHGQFYNFPGEYSFSLLTQKQLAQKNATAHAGIQPYIHFFSDVYKHVADSQKLYKYIKNDEGIDLTFYDHLIKIQLKNESFKLRLDPLVNFEFGRDLNETRKKNIKQSTNTRGFIGSGYIGKNVYFESLFAENQSFFPDYLSQSVVSNSIVPGQGRWKEFKVTGYDYAFSSGFVSVQAAKNFNIQVGHGKQKIGEGYRSLLLSDNAFNYPYVRFTHQWLKGRIQYSNIYSVLMNLASSSKKVAVATERLFQKKAASFHYVSINLSKAFNIGLFQGMIWTSGDERNRHYITWEYVNPLIYTNLLRFQLNNKNNILAGGQANVKLTNGLSCYAQLMLDDLSNTDTLGNGWGYQGGAKYFDAFGIKNLFLQAEFNFVSETSYKNVDGATTNQSYTHYGQNLAYTPGKGRELVLLSDYKYKRWVLHLKYNYQEIPLNNKISFINNVFNARLAYVINTAYNLNIFAGYSYRNQNFYTFKSLNNITSCLFIGLRTNLYNFYYDF